MVARAFREFDDLPHKSAVIDGFRQIVCLGGFFKIEEEFDGEFDEAAPLSFFWVASEDA
jgi:hypothetical protein